MNTNPILAWAGILLPVLSFVANLWLMRIVAELRLEIREKFVTNEECLENRNHCKELRQLEREARHAAS